MSLGTIKSIKDKGFGFIDCDDKEGDLFFHATGTADGVEFGDLREGQRVKFSESEGAKGPRAENVCPV